MFWAFEKVINTAADKIASPNWVDKISVIISIISALISLAAVFVAGYVAWKQIDIAKKQNEIAKSQSDIAAQQNRIALFKERYSVYCEFQKIINIRGHIENDTDVNKKNLLYAIEIIYGFHPHSHDKYDLTKTLAKLLTQFKISEYQMMQAMFLFSGIEESDIYNLLKVRFDLISCFFEKSGSASPCIKEFINECDNFEKKYIGLMEEQLNLT